MFGWRKRSEGFEWREYVRTTVLVRRADRQKRLDDARLEALAKITGVRDRGVEAGKNGLASVWGSIKDVMQSLLDILLTVVMAMGEALWRGLKALAGSVAGLAQRLPRPNVTVPKLTVPKLRAPDLRAPELRNAGGLAQRLKDGAAGEAREGPAPRAARRIPKLNLPSMPKFGFITARSAGFAALAIAAALGLGPMLGTTPGQSTGQQASVSPADAAAPVVPVAALETSVSGRATAVTGSLLRVNGTLVELTGIEAPGPKHPCLKANGRRWSCATSAANALQRLVRGETVSCEISGRTDAGRAAGSCKIADRDIAGELVRNGHVFAADGMFNAYAGDEEKAQAAKLGLWQGETVRPKEWRERAWEEAKRTAPDGCPIKGFVRAAGRIYSMPWSADYASGKVREVKGERWFCSEDDARAAGFKLSSRL